MFNPPLYILLITVDLGLVRRRISFELKRMAERLISMLRKNRFRRRFRASKTLQTFMRSKETIQMCQLATFRWFYAVAHF